MPLPSFELLLYSADFVNLMIASKLCLDEGYGRKERDVRIGEHMYSMPDSISFLNENSRTKHGCVPPTAATDHRMKLVH